jgi:hypothetical protein
LEKFDYWNKMDLKKRDPGYDGHYDGHDDGTYMDSCMLDNDYNVFENIDW